MFSLPHFLLGQHVKSSVQVPACQAERIMLLKLCCRLDTDTMFKVREWERFQFSIDYEHQQVWFRLSDYTTKLEQTTVKYYWVIFCCHNLNWCKDSAQKDSRANDSRCSKAFHRPKDWKQSLFQGQFLIHTAQSMQYSLWPCLYSRFRSLLDSLQWERSGRSLLQRLTLLPLS